MMGTEFVQYRVSFIVTLCSQRGKLIRLSTKPKPSLLRLFLLFSRSCYSIVQTFDAVASHISLPAWIVDVIPRHVQKQRLDRYRLHLWRVCHKIFEIYSVEGIFVKVFYEWRGFDARLRLVGCVKVVEFDEGPVLCYEAAEEVLEGGDLGGGDVERWRS